MRKVLYITVVICAVCFGFGSTPIWLCVSANGSVATKTNAEASCESIYVEESDGRDENAVAVPVPDDCCFDILISLDGTLEPATLTRSQKVDSSPAPAQTAAICTLSVPAAADFGLLTQSPPPGSSYLSFPIRTVVLLI